MEFINTRTEHEKRSIGAKCGHVIRRISKGEPLKGKTLKFALEILGQNEQDSTDSTIDLISDKIKKGQELDDYEKSILEDIGLIPFQWKMRIFVEKNIESYFLKFILKLIRWRRCNSRVRQPNMDVRRLLMPVHDREACRKTSLHKISMGN